MLTMPEYVTPYFPLENLLEARNNEIPIQRRGNVNKCKKFPAALFIVISVQLFILVGVIAFSSAGKISKYWIPLIGLVIAITIALYVLRRYFIDEPPQQVAETAV